ncbi:redox-regulated ATPase YchF [Candidatus Gribaldobacteria bacterium]|nr:redox-regulated ATPase YchF [Candidatus Gribaldobacteria bacterium]
MSLSIGIVGLPNVGKSTLFQAITKKQVACQNYPFCTIEPNVGIVAVLDERVDKLANLCQSKQKIYSGVEFHDIAGLVEGAHKGEGLGNQFLSHIRETDLLVYILRIFENDKVINTRNELNPLKDKAILETELALKDLATLEKRLNGLESEVKQNKKGAKEELLALKKAQDLLNKGIFSLDDFSREELKIIQALQLLSFKPKIFVLNGKKSDLKLEVKEHFEQNNLPYLIVDILEEADSAGLSLEERKEFGLSELSSLDSLIKECYQKLGLISFFTTGPDETRAWTLKKGKKAPQAGGVIHTDFENNFIKAEVINWQGLLDMGGFVRAREKGLIRLEGKDYLVQDGDVIEIKAGK